MSALPKRKCVNKYGLNEGEIRNLTRKEKLDVLDSARDFDSPSNAWNALEAAFYRLFITKYGFGQHELAHYLLPHKNHAQLNVFLQKLCGQQSLAPFTGMSIDPYRVFLLNCDKNSLRKNGMVTHEGIAKSTAQKSREKDWYRKNYVEVFDFDMPEIEDRSRNYSKLLCQTKRTFQRVEDEIEKRIAAGRLERSVVWSLPPKKPEGEQFLEPVKMFPNIRKWNLNQELRSKKGQDNFWPLIRKAEDPQWYLEDQSLHWSWLNGSALDDIWDQDFAESVPQVAGDPKRFNAWDYTAPREWAPHKKSVKRFQTEMELMRLGGEEDIIREAKRKARKVLRQSNYAFEEEMSFADDNKEEEELQDKDEVPENAESRRLADGLWGKSVAKWTTKDVCKFLKSEGFDEEVLDKVQDLKIKGSTYMSLTEDVGQELQDMSNGKYDKAMHSATQKYGFKKAKLRPV